MLDWIRQYSDTLTVFSNIGTLIIWLVYAQLLYLGFRRQRRPRLLINRGKNKDIQALCIISNMSAESVYIEYIIAELKTSENTITMDVTDFEQEYQQEEEERSGSAKAPLGTVSENTRQGPMTSGSCSHIGTFEHLIIRTAREDGIELRGHRPAGDLEFHSLTIRLVGIYGSEDRPIGAERTFELHEDGDNYRLVPASWDTRRLASWRQRRRLVRLIAELNTTDFPTSKRAMMKKEK